jgi:signal transduction histidine kinase
MRRFMLPIRWRLALTSASLTFVILLGFAAVIAAFTTSTLRSDFDNELKATASDIASRVPTKHGFPELSQAGQLALRLATSRGSAMRILESGGEGPSEVAGGRGALAPVEPDTFAEVFNEDCNCTYRVYTRPIFPTESPDKLRVEPDTPIGFVQFARDQDQVAATIRQVDTFLALGVAVGTLLALLAGLAVARRAMTPIADLTYVAGHVSRTRDPGVTLPRTRANDEVADLARTLDHMLQALDEAQSETEATLTREREFVADASHELRTPLTSVLANLELLQDELEGEQSEIAGSALRSTQRMRRLVADLLFLANADTGRSRPHDLVDLGQVVRDAASETAPLSSAHEVRVEAPTGLYVEGVADELHRLVVNLVQNAVAHTPEGTIVRVRLRRRDGTLRPGQNGVPEAAAAVLEVSDNGPGIAPELRERIFERFVRAPGPGAGSGSGLGLAIVHAVATAHGGSVKLGEAPDGGARFVVRIPTASRTAAADAPPPSGPEPEPVAQTSTTTGSTRGRRFRRS